MCFYVIYKYEYNDNNEVNGFTMSIYLADIIYIFHVYILFLTVGY